MILSDKSIREELAAGRIIIQPLDESAVQPSSVDLHVDRYFRVFRNDTTPFIDPKEPQEDLTELVEMPDGRPFILHPGEFVLGSTLERVALPDDLVARLEGKSSLGRLGLLIHSSLPASERVLVMDEHGRLSPMLIGDVVRKQLPAKVAGFDPETLEVEYHDITGWYEGPPDRIFEVHLQSGRRVRLTAGHNLFGLDRSGQLIKLRTQQLRPGAQVAIPRTLPEPPPSPQVPTIDVVRLVPESEYQRIVCHGPAVADAFERDGDGVARALREAGFRHVDFYRDRSQLPLHVARQLGGFMDRLGPDDSLTVRGGRNGFPAQIEVDADLAWVLGLYVAEGSRRANQFTISNTDQSILDRVEATLDRLRLPVYRAPNAITCSSSFTSELLVWLGTGHGAYTKRIPPAVFGWPLVLIDAFLEGLIDGDGSRDDTRVSVWTTSQGLVDDLLLLAVRLGRRAGSCARKTRNLSQVYFPTREHKLLTSVPLADELLVEARNETGLRQHVAARVAGYRHASDLNNIERRTGRDAVRFATLRRLREAYRSQGVEPGPALRRLDALTDGDLAWDRVVEVVDTGVVEPIFDLEVRPNGRKIENFVAGTGVFVSNTAGFVDAGWDGHLTLELSNVANLPIAIYPGMKIGQISFLRMTTPADHPYGSGEAGSKYQGQKGPTPSRYYLNFNDESA